MPTPTKGKYELRVGVPKAFNLINLPMRKEYPATKKAIPVIIRNMLLLLIIMMNNYLNVF